MKILAIDPGVTSGYCFAELDPVGWKRLEIRPEQHVDDVDGVWDRIKEFEPRYIICEDFEYRNKSRHGLVLFSVQAIGVVRLYEFKAITQISVVLQTAATGKGYYTNKLMKDMGVFKPGAAWEHSMDATRHLLHWLTFREGYQYIQGTDIKDIVRII